MMLRLMLVLVWCAALVAAGDLLVKFRSESKVHPRSGKGKRGASCKSCRENLRGYDGGLGRTDGPVVWPWSNEKYNPQDISIIRKGRENEPSFRIFFRNKRGPISPFHDIPLYADLENNIFNMVVEIPRWWNDKIEVSKDFPLNPLFHDERDGNLRYTPNVFPYHGYSWNYGSFPQTWEDPTVKDKFTGLPGDNDPIDVIEIGQLIPKTGDILKVKVLGILGLIDQGETDWKVIAIDVNDVMASKLNDIDDVNSLMPTLVDNTREWFRVYKTAEGGEENTFAFNGQEQNRTFAHGIIMYTYGKWQRLILGQTESNGIQLGAVRVPNGVEPLTVAQAEEIVDAAEELGPPAPRPERADGVDFVGSSGN